MGMSATASIGWGIDLGGGDGDCHESIAHLLERDGIGEALDDSALTELFGWTEPRPAWPAVPEMLSGREREAHPAVREHREAVTAWERRRDIAAPVTADTYGYIDYAGWVLITKRSYQDVEWGCDPVDCERLVRYSAYEAQALHKALDSIGYTGDRTFRLLLWASYG